MSFLSGPSLSGNVTTKGLVQYLDEVLDPGNSTGHYAYIPYVNVTGSKINAAEALFRYQNLKNFYTARGHIWTATGAYYLHSRDTGAKLMELRAFTSYPVSGSKFFFLVDSDGKAPGQQLPATPPAHNGAWVDIVTLKVLVDEAAAVTQLQSNTLDVFAKGMTDPDLFLTVQGDANLHYYLSAGLFDVLAFNPSGLFFPATGKLNPLSIPAIREAMNWAVDRDHIVGEIYGGMAYARYTCIGTQTGDYINRYPALMAATEAAYAYDFALANSTIYAAMMAINGTTYVDGKYYYEPPA
jgi:hypothetical protein